MRHDVKPCRHCGHPRGYRAKNLCWRCSNTESIRLLYPNCPHYGRVSPLVQRGVVALVVPAESTCALPGSEEKIQVMTERLARGESCFHPDDPRKERALQGVPGIIHSRFPRSDADPCGGGERVMRYRMRQ